MAPKRKRFNEKQSTIIAALVAGGLLLIMGGGLFLGVSRAGEISEEMDGKKALRDDLKRKERELPKLRKEINSLEIEVERMVRILPNDQEIANLVQTLDEISIGTLDKGSTIKILGFQPDEDNALRGLKKNKEEPEGAFTAHPYKIQARGTFCHFGKLVNLLENHIRFIGVRAFEIRLPKCKGVSTDPNKLITIRLMTYTYNRGKARAPGEDAARREIDKELFVQPGFVFERRNRRDPFEISPDMVGAAVPGAEKRLSETEQLKLMVLAEEDLKMMKYHIENKETDEALKRYISIEEIVGRRFTNKECFNRVGEIYNIAKEEIAKIKGAAVRHAILRAEVSIVRMAELFAQEKHEEVIARDKRLQRELAGVKAFEENLKDRIEALAGKSEKLSARSKIRREFSRANIAVTGFVRMDKPIVVLNGGPFAEVGRTINLGRATFYVAAIDVDNRRIEIVYKGERIIITGAPGRPDAGEKISDNESGQKGKEDEKGAGEDDLDTPAAPVPPSGKPGRQT